MTGKVYPRLGPLLTIEDCEKDEHNIAPDVVIMHHSKARQIDRHCHEILKALSALDGVKPEIVARLYDIRTYVSTAKWFDWRHDDYDTTS